MLLFFLQTFFKREKPTLGSYVFLFSLRKFLYYSEILRGIKKTTASENFILEFFKILKNKNNTRFLDNFEFIPSKYHQTGNYKMFCFVWPRVSSYYDPEINFKKIEP